MEVPESMRVTAERLVRQHDPARLSRASDEELAIAVAERFIAEGMDALEAAGYALTIGYMKAIVDMKKDLLSN
jgi:hypothetical protein